MLTEWKPSNTARRTRFLAPLLLLYSPTGTNELVFEAVNLSITGAIFLVGKKAMTQ